MPKDIRPNTAPRNNLRALLQHAQRPILLAVAGDSGSGKTTYSQGIRRLLGEDMVAAISLDGYHKEDRAMRKISGRSPLDPRANDLKLIKSHLRTLRAGQAVEIPVYNHETGLFDEPQLVQPKPVILVEGLHALYPNFLPYFDFTLFVDSDREVKWRWKLERDVNCRGYDPEEVKREMQRREVAYKRWVDFQKTHADVIVKVHESELASLAVQEYEGRLPENCYHMEVIVSPSTVPLPALYLPVDFNGMTKHDALPFMLANVPSSYWGRQVNVVHVDGIIPVDAMCQLEQEMVRFTGLTPQSECGLGQPNNPIATLGFTQLVVAWPFLGHIAGLLQQWVDQKTQSRPICKGNPNRDRR
ncbi:phosphoribulokinase [Alkalilimnicola ehrlichii]|uniref:Phosphoribulokinase n=1 Tax=Alkalilimnicola ehrlichii TaxID=351052 RepID=A0A3E0WI52_9GAMM|nr:phosphoribulokinase [Alkalilimnicola ehrlichii]RFA29055.1 phosphoribulokinase [Alkalilimnicola ehrlichii]RFA31841.1 phosphoribulokinase [Alkalilimnicola ehrlichii]